MNTNHFVSKSNVIKVIFDAKVLASNAEDCARVYVPTFGTPRRSTRGTTRGGPR